MRHHVLAIAISLLGISFSCAASEPMNLDTLKKTVIAYHDSGEYAQNIAQVMQQAMTYLQMRVQQNAQAAHPQKLAIVLDIDETSLSNYSYMRSMDFGGTEQMFDQNIKKADDPAIAPTLALYQLAEKDHVAVFFITGRTENLRQATAKNLKQVGYNAWNGLSLKPDNYTLPSVVPYKSGERKKIAAKGYDIVLNAGDQQSDLNGGYADKTFKLPDPYYFIP